MPIYLTEWMSIAQVDIEAEDWEEAQSELEDMILAGELPPGTEIVGELEDEYDLSTL
jgi:DNA-binding GntR family transcriptional regulator